MARSFRLVAAMLAASVASVALADVKLPAIFSDNMVLQKGTKVPVFGWADAGEAVTVKAGTLTAQATAGPDGKFQAILDTTALAAQPAFDVTVAGKNTLTIKNAIVGEVWVASGQSNMEWVVRNSNNAEAEIKNSANPLIRMFTVKKAIAQEPQKDCVGKWELAAPEATGAFSAVGYFFARELNAQLKVPVGVIHTSWGGTPAESWTSTAGLKSDPDFAPILERFAKAVENYPAAQAKWKEAVKKWEADGKKGRAPGAPMGPNNPHAPSGLYNAMIMPVVPYAIKGAIWYQGESNAGRAYQYRKLFPAMITDWRKTWNQGDFSFYFVQLANFLGKDKDPVDSDWAELREAQTMTLKLPNTGMAVITDIGEEKDIHPKNKQDVGKRLAQWALNKDYGKTDVVASGPLYQSMKVEGDSIRITFDFAQCGLTTKPRADHPASAQKLTGFAICGEDKKFVWADAKIDGQTVVVKSPAVTRPVAVRYSWNNNPDGNLYNCANLPASPFRTDDFPGRTQGKN